MKVFVTGASGFIGQAVVRQLLDHGHQVLGLARNDEGAAALEALGVEVHRGNLDDLDSLAKGAAAADGVIHLAFKNKEMMADYAGVCAIDRAAITAIGQALEGSNKPFVITSGTLMLARGKMGRETDGPDLAHPVSSARGASEGLALSFADKGVRAAVVRLAPTNHGEGDHGFTAMTVAKARETGVSAYIGTGENRWPAVHRLDTAALFRLVLEKGRAGGVYHAVADEGVAIKDLAAAIGKRLGIPVVSKSIEEAKAHFGFAAFALAEDNPTSSEQTRAELGWVPEHPSLLEDIEAGVYADD
ncbi:putative oxidoreductase [Thozetella sp. PMI_491]|nr:putative oxidoreductase [Thozetella sp. PMI_491]